MRHARGRYVGFADADGASKFDDVEKLVRSCQEVEDDRGRGIAIGSRAHLVGSEAVVKVCYSTTMFYHLLDVLTDHPSLSAFPATQLSHAFVPLVLALDDATRHIEDQGHPMRFQTIFAADSALYHPLHAFRRLDF